jgi:pilus assembly protein CpaB
VSRRRRSLLLLGLALLLGGLAASDVASREAALERRLGPVVPVVVARAALPAGEPVDPRRLTVRHVPARFAPRGGLSTPAEAAGRRTSAAVAAGADLTTAALAEPGGGVPGAPVRRGERVADVVATGSAELVVPGARVDVLVTREPRPGAAGLTELALEDVEVLAAAPAAGADEASGARVAASLRVTLRQAVFLAAAQSFARELRLLPRAGDDRTTAREPVAYGADLG